MHESENSPALASSSRYWLFQLAHTHVWRMLGWAVPIGQGVMGSNRS